jgi:hypothetical protein
MACASRTCQQTISCRGTLFFGAGRRIDVQHQPQAPPTSSSAAARACAPCSCSSRRSPVSSAACRSRLACTVSAGKMTCGKSATEPN